jgi:hypothetical protein
MYKNDEFTHEQAVKAHNVSKMNNVQEAYPLGVTILVNCGLGMSNIDQLTKSDWKINQIHKNADNEVIISLYPDR